MRVFDVVDSFRPRNVAHCVPAAPDRLVDIRAGAVAVTQSSDVLVHRDGHMFVTDPNAGLSVLAFDGA